MAQTNPAPTRMALSETKKKLMAAQRSHKLLKDKRDELMRRFLMLTEENRQLRDETEKELENAYAALRFSMGTAGRAQWETALLWPRETVEIEIQTQKAMGVTLQKLTLLQQKIQTTPCLWQDEDMRCGMELLKSALPKLIQLAEAEQACRQLADEIERTRRRVNALEYVLIPQYQQSARRIAMQLEENDRATNTRLRKVKDLVLSRR